MASSFNPRKTPPQYVPETSFWGALDPAERQAFRSLAHERTFAAGAKLMRQGGTANHVIVILRGWTRIYVRDGGVDRVLAERGPGQLVGERGALEVSVRSATVEALEMVQALVMKTEHFADFVSAHPAVLKIVEGQVYQRLTEDSGRGLADRRHDDDTRYRGYDDPDYEDSGYDDHHWRDPGAVGPGPDARAGLTGHTGPAVPAGPIALRPENGVTAERPAGHVPVLNGEICTVVLTDVAAFGALTRTDEDRLIIRKTLLAITSAALGDLWDFCSVDDRGDGLLLVAPPSILTTRVIECLLTALPPALRRHNRTYGPAIQIQLRVAVDAGPVVSDGLGVSGEAIIRTARLLEAPALKKAVTGTGANLGVIVSSFVYDNAIRHCGGVVDPAEYRKVHVHVKETSAHAWMQLIDRRRPELPPHRELTAAGTSARI